MGPFDNEDGCQDEGLAKDIEMHKGGDVGSEQNPELSNADAASMEHSLQFPL